MMKRFLVLVALLAGVLPALAQLNASSTWVTVSGTNTLTSTGIPGVVAQADLLGVPLRFIPPNSNTSAVTYNPNSIGGVAVKKPTRGGLAALTGGEIQAAQEAQFLWDGTEYVCTTCVNTYKLPTYQYLTSGSAATYTTPAGVTYLEIKQIGGGGGGGSPGTGAGGTGGTTTFGSTTTIGGNGGANSTTAGAGGSGGTTGTGTVIRRLTGGAGNAGVNATQAAGATLTLIMPGGSGCVSQFAGASPSTPSVSTPVAGIANTGSGGAGDTVQIASGAGTYNSGGAGGCGEYVEYFVNAPLATYTYTIGAGGTAGSTGAGIGLTGGVVVKENYN